jgi:hypothetical protein
MSPKAIVQAAIQAWEEKKGYRAGCYTGLGREK